MTYKITGRRVAGEGLAPPTWCNRKRIVRHPDSFEFTDLAEVMRKLRALRAAQGTCGWQWTYDEHAAST